MTRVFSRAAESRGQLMAELRSERLVVLSVEETRDDAALPPRWHPSWLRPVTGFDVEMGFRQLAAMLRSGVTLLSALQTVADQSFKPRAMRTWREVAEAVRRGRALAEALADRPRLFGELAVRLSEVGERTGELERAMSRAADQMEARRNLRTQVINALVYPALAVAMAVGVSAFLVLAVIPKISEFLRSGGAELPELTQLLMDCSAWVRANGLSLAVGIVASAVAWNVVRRNERGREAQDVLLLRLPVAGRILRLSGTALFARSMQIMTESGVTLLDALATASRLMANRRLRRRVARAHDLVMQGNTLRQSLAEAPEFLPMLSRMAAVGESTGALPEAFGEAARFHEMMLAVAVKRFAIVIEPVMICVTGLIVGFVYIAFFMAIFAIAGSH